MRRRGIKPFIIVRKRRHGPDSTVVEGQNHLTNPTVSDGPTLNGLPLSPPLQIRHGRPVCRAFSLSFACVVGTQADA
jgi:hypothetical protein